jgi:hypothetical protein
MKNWLLILIFFAAAIQVSAQINSSTEPTENASLAKPSKTNTNKFFNKDNFVVGGGFGLGMGSLFTSCTIAPEVSYHLVPDRLVFGGRFVYNYYRDKTVLINNSYPTLNIFGGGPFARAYIWKGLFAHGEYEYTYLRKLPYLVADPRNPTQTRVVYRDVVLNGLLVGGGFHQNFESGPGFYFLVLFNVLGSTDIITPNPVFRTGFTYTFKKL